MRVIIQVEEGANKGTSFECNEHGTLLVGRSKKACFHLPIKDKYLSRFHFLIEINPPRCVLTDLNSRSGTWVNGVRVKVVELKNGDHIRAGHTVFRVDLKWSPGEQEQFSTLPWQDNIPATPTEEEPCIPGFRVETVLGRGGMGIVYRALREKDGSIVAVKTIRPRGRASLKDVERFLRETALHCRLSHPHIVAFHANGEVEGLLYFVMEYVPGIDGARLVENQLLSIPRAVGLVCQLLDALAYTHQAGIVHRDIKPANLLVSAQNGRDFIKLADFGLARLYLASTLSGMTLTGHVAGTVGYMAPEQVADLRHAGPAADQYSAGATLYYLLTGKNPFPLQGQLEDQLIEIVDRQPIPIQQQRNDIPDELAVIVHRSLAKKPTGRFRDVSVLKAALIPFLEPDQYSETTHPGSGPSRSLHR